MDQLPALSTPQVDWARAHMGKKPMPVCKIYQPEVAWRAIHVAAHANRKEIWFGSTTVEAILGDEAASFLLDEYLAETGVEGQSAKAEVSPDRKDNLFEPVPGDFAAHGRFDDVAHDQIGRAHV